MLKLKYSVIQNTRLYGVFQALMNEKMSTKTAYKMKRYADKLDQETKTYQTFMTGLLDKYGEKNEKGEVVYEYEGEGEEKRPVGYKLKDKESFAKEASEFLDSEFTIEQHPLFAAELSEVKMTPNDLIVMEPFIADIDNL